MIKRKKTSGTIRQLEWKHLVHSNQLQEILEQSENTPQLIFKYSSRCGLSDMMLRRMEEQWESEGLNGIEPLFLDILSYRSISNAIEHQFDVLHESPQILVVKQGECVYSASHTRINLEEVKSYL